STPVGLGAIAVIRLSGGDSFGIARSMFVCPDGSCPDFVNLMARHGFIVDPDLGTFVDEVVLVPYQGPRTYTGEDLVEISCHGNPVIAQEILYLAIKLGARLARAGEFTERAFLSGRIDLTQAEAVLDLIQAKTSRQGRVALTALSGQLGKQIAAVRSTLVNLLSSIVASIDFPEEVAEVADEEIVNVIRQCRLSIETLLRTARTGHFLRQGLRLAIVGRPNAGKSSLLNQLLQFDRAIVTDVPGTTRDCLEEPLDINGIPVFLIDTAGIRSTVDQIELMGMERTRRAVDQADMVLFVMDLIEGWGAPEEEIQKMVYPRPYILLGNKVDLCPQPILPDGLLVNGQLVGNLCISAKTGTGIESLTPMIESWVFEDEPKQDMQVMVNARQAELCLRAIQALDHTEETLRLAHPQDCFATDLRLAIDALSEISGEMITDEVVEAVFSNFCVGK
ncbi:MAG: tRNA uridine-5-carboxymethylaminomethyl(34) synthesis GTPase MnmE, partial [Candidatus Melainabacteria bacterium]|nr:tRNA uridine-5-carboxymethylaminomethyl(34) synthesis GTPase MnmE [Candidatus Melainabacteria bacterium]